MVEHLIDCVFFFNSRNVYFKDTQLQGYIYSHTKLNIFGKQILIDKNDKKLCHERINIEKVVLCFVVAHMHLSKTKYISH